MRRGLAFPAIKFDCDLQPVAKPTAGQVAILPGKDFIRMNPNIDVEDEVQSRSRAAVARSRRENVRAQSSASLPSQTPRRLRDRNSLKLQLNHHLQIAKLVHHPKPAKTMSNPTPKCFLLSQVLNHTTTNSLTAFGKRAPANRTLPLVRQPRIDQQPAPQPSKLRRPNHRPRASPITSGRSAAASTTSARRPSRATGARTPSLALLLRGRGRRPMASTAKR